MNEQEIEQKIIEEKAKCWDILFVHAELWKNHTPHITWNAVELYDRLIGFMVQVENERVDKFHADKKEPEVEEVKKDYIYQCPECARVHCDSLYRKPICVHDDNIAYEMRAVYEPGNHEESGGVRATKGVFF